MTPRVTKRRFLSGLALAGLTSLAGCSDALADNEATSTESDTETGTDTTVETTRTPNTEPETATDDHTPTEEQSTAESNTPETPERMVREYIQASTEANDSAVVGAYYHPIHPFHPDNWEGEKDEAWLLSDGTVSAIEIETSRKDVSPETVLTAPVLQAVGMKRKTVAKALDGEQTAIVEAAVTRGNSVTQEIRYVTVTTGNDWTILAQGIKSPDDETDPNPAPLEARVVDEVTFDSKENRARVHFVESPVADSVTAKAKKKFSSRSSDTVQALEYFDVRLDPGGDELVVTATVDGETRTVHRERYPSSHRIVDDVTYEEDPDSELFDATARVTFTGNQEGERLTITSTVQGDEMRVAPAENATYGVVGVNPDGDEIVVTVTADGTTEEVHRERYHT
jgi:hypothetical protein